MPSWGEFLIQCVGERFGARVIWLVLAMGNCVSPAQAQITFDGSLGAAGALTGTNIAILPASGLQVGGNLFHSFSQFNVNTGQFVTFTGPASVSNVISRVTGGSASNIDGYLGSSIANANLFLINPSGVIFGSHASLNVNGSFYATTADYLTLGASGVFRATNPAASTLSSAPPSAFGFLGPTVAPVSVTGTASQVATLRTAPGKEISLIGGDITLSNAALRAPGGRINLASVASSGEITLEPAGIAAPGVTAYGNLAATGATASAGTLGQPASGSIHIVGGRFSLLNSQFDTNNAGVAGGNGIGIKLSGDLSLDASSIAALSFGSGSAGPVSISARDVGLTRSSIIWSYALGNANAGNVTVSARDISLYTDGIIGSATSAGGDVGNVTISARNIGLHSGGEIFSTASGGSGHGGNVNVTASRGIVIAGTSSGGSSAGIFATSLSAATGDAGTISVTADLITVGEGGVIDGSTFGPGNAGGVTVSARDIGLSNGGKITSSTFLGSGRGGDVSVTASGVIAIAGKSGGGFLAGIYATSESAATGDGGTIAVRADSIMVGEGGTINSSTYGRGNAGGITVSARDIGLSNSGAITSSTFGGSGQGGDVSVTASGRIAIAGTNSGGFFAGIFATSESAASGDGGAITVAADSITVGGGGTINSSTYGRGNAGEVTVSARDIGLSNGGGINSSTFGGSGHGGDVSVTASGGILISGASSGGAPSGILASSNFAGAGDAGAITVSADSITIVDGGRIRASSSGAGLAGSIAVNAAGKLQLLAGGSISTEALFSDGGNIDIRAGQLVYLENSQITTSVGTGAGNGGNITIDPIFVVLNNSQIIANAFGGNGGNISIVSEFFVTDTGSLVQASSQLGVSGSVVIAAPQSNVGSSVTVLPSAYFDASALMRESCAARSGRAANSFVQAGRGGLGAQPGDLAFGDYGWRGPARAGPAAEARPPRSVVLALGGCAGG